MDEQSKPLELENEKLKRKLAKLKKINQSLMLQVERSTNQTGSAMVLFQNAIDLEEKVTKRTHSLETAKSELEESNKDLTVAMKAAKSASVAKSQFLATMSHEIRTPMNGLIGVLTLLDQDMPPEKRKLLDTAQNCAEDLLVLINDILDFSKIEAGKMHLESIDFNALELAEVICELHSSTAHRKGLEIICNGTPSVNYNVIGDPLRLRQIVSNLTSNAIKFTKSGTIVVHALTTSNATGTKSLRYEVTDDGIGMSESVQKSLFQSFSQANSSTTREFGGTGLGLAISKKLVNLMGGTIGVDSEEGKGSTFWIEIPYQESTTKNPDPCPIELKDKRVIIVDSVDATRYNLERWLRHWGCEVHTAKCLKQFFDDVEAMQHAERPFYDFVIIDKKRIDAHYESWQPMHKKLVEKHKTQVITLHCLTGDNNSNSFDSVTKLHKPVSVSRLLECITGKIAKPSKEEDTHKPVKHISNTLRILLVDDNVTNRMIASQLLKQKHGIIPKTANNGEEAIQFLKDHDFDIVLMDCMMPVMDGYDATRAIREGQSGDKNIGIPIIALTANAMDGDREHCIAAGMSDYIAKPIRPAGLAEAIERWADKKHSSQHGAEQPETAIVDAVATDEQIFDPEYLIDISNGDESVITNLITFFLENIETTMNELKEAATKRESCERLRFCTHQVKGVAANYGANRLFKILTMMEEHCVNNKLDDAIALSNQAYSVAEKTIQEVTAYEEAKK